MAVASALPRKIAVFVETAFVTGGPADWSTNGTYMYAIGVDTSGLAQQSLPNENNVTRPRFKHGNILGLRNSSMSMGLYLHPSATHADEAAAATAFNLATILKSALGGQRLGYSIGVASSGSEETDELEVDSDPGFEVGDWIFVYDTSAGRGYFHRIEAIAEGPPVTLTLDRDKEFTPHATDDVVKAVIDCYIHAYATTQHDHANHTTLQFCVQGDLSEDVVIAKGCKPTLSIEPIQAGQPVQASLEIAVTTFDAADEATQDDFGSATPVGEAGLVPGIGATTRVLMADFGSPLATVPVRGQITIVPGPTYQPVTGPNGHEGVHGYYDDTSQDTTLELMVPFDADYPTEYRAQQHKHALIQIGEGIECIGFYFSELEYSAEPVRNDEGSLAGCTLSFRGLENSASAGSLTGDALEKWRSAFHIMLVA